MQTIFIRNSSVTFRMVVLVIASIALMTADHRWHSLEMVRSTLSNVVYPLQYTIDLPIKLYYWADEVLSTKQSLLEKNREFEARHLENRVQLQKLDILEKENDRLRSLLSATPKIPERLLISEIVNVDVDPYRQLIILNKGSSSDVYQGQAIIDAHGIMGQVVHVGPLSSSVMLITDASHSIPVQIDRTGLRANAFGTGKMDQLDLRHLPHNADIQVDDMLISSGLGGVFPPNYPVASITKVERTAGEPFATIEAKPLAHLDTSREVLLVWRNLSQRNLPQQGEQNTSKNNREITDVTEQHSSATTDVDKEKEEENKPAQGGDSSE
ncbi:MAG: rod shape-determining protein MreC [Gammaproteobacteria bacterium]|nr:rod shape-determining protein MreC [Gammaproteobacteria bacterium]